MQLLSFYVHRKIDIYKLLYLYVYVYCFSKLFLRYVDLLSARSRRFIEESRVRVCYFMLIVYLI